MKTAVSLPDDLFLRIDHLANRTGRSRSRVYADALREYLGRHSPEDVTERLNAVIADIHEDRTEIGFRRAAARRALQSSDW